VARSSKTFRIFVSSTFNDLKEERNMLQAGAFRRLRDTCTQSGARFQAIDLRWGVSQEAGRDQQTMKICLSEIARCQRVTKDLAILGEKRGRQRRRNYSISMTTEL
jgi:NACHT domain- and WD repeat-containing protein